MPLVNDQSSGSKSRSSKISSSHTSGRHSLSEVTSDQPKFPRIEDCAHFHYESVDYERIKVSFLEDSSDGLKINGSLNLEGFNPAFCVRISCKGNTWVVRRSLSHFETLDNWLHECVFDRKFSQLPELKERDLNTQTLDDIERQLQSYLAKLSNITDVDTCGVQIVCAPVLHWLEIDNHGRNLAPHALGDVADINIPAVAAARVIRRYQASDNDELNLNVGDMVSIIEMGASGWWRGKQGFRVGSFPSQCVRRINSITDVVGTHDRSFAAPPTYGTQAQTKPIARKHGKFMDFLRSFLDTRPSKAHLKKKGILRERMFGCDLGELLHRTGEDIPTVVVDCTKFVEEHGVVDGIYRISGVSSHIRHLRYEFDSDRRPDLNQSIANMPKLGDVPGMSQESTVICDPHSVAGLCKLYFRELPNPLLTYQLYNRFASAVSDYEAEERLLKVHDVIQQLPPPHYRTLKHLITHLRFMADRDDRTSMHCRNLAIVWAPNLLRSREIEAGLAAFTEARVQSVVTEFLIVNGDLLFSEKLQTMQYDADHKPPRPRSLMILPSPKLISLEEAQARSKSGIVTPVSSESAGSTAAASVTSGVRLRNADGVKTSSNERRKRNNKKLASYTTAQTSTSQSSRSVRKGHRQTASCVDQLPSLHEPKQAWIEECLATTSSTSTTQTTHGSGWKTKLGSLLRKSAPLQSSVVARQPSLRRTQSDDSLISSHSPQSKVISSSRDLPFIKPLSHAISCEESGLSDRRRPEPQVPHCMRSLSTSSPVLLKEKVDSRCKKSEKQHLKPEDVTSKTSAKRSSKTSGKIDRREALTNSKSSDQFANNRSNSPFYGLESDFPAVMGENGLDFDPLSFRPSNAFSPTKQGKNKGENINRPVDGPVGESSSKQVEKRRIKDSDTTEQDKDHRVTNIDPAFVAMPIVDESSLKETPIKTFIGTNAILPGATDARLDSSSETVTLPQYSLYTSMPRPEQTFTPSDVKDNSELYMASQNSNNNKQSGMPIPNNLDGLTADTIGQVLPKSSLNVPRKMSAADKLGISYKKAKIHSARKVNVDNSTNDQLHCATDPPLVRKETATVIINDRESKSAEHSVASGKNSHISPDDIFSDLNRNELQHKRTSMSDPSRRISVQVYNVPDKGHLEKQGHYGSFIALVATNVGSKPTCEAGNPSYNSRHQRDISPRQYNYDGANCRQQSPPSANSKTRTKTYSQNNLNTVYSPSYHDYNTPRCSRMHSQGANEYVEPFHQRLNSPRYHGTCPEVPRLPTFSDVEYSGQTHLTPRTIIFSPRLNTFNPEGKQREDYCHANMSPRSDPDHLSYAHDHYQHPRMRSHSDDELVYENMGGAKTSAPYTLNDNQSEGKNKSFQVNATRYPRPAPRKHFRSHSAGDGLESPPNSSSQNAKPTPLPRTFSTLSRESSSYAQPSSCNPHENRVYLTGASYANDTYEDWYDYSHPHCPEPTQKILPSGEQYRYQQQDARQNNEMRSSHPPLSYAHRHDESKLKNIGQSRASYSEGLPLIPVPGRSYNNPSYETHMPFYQQQNLYYGYDDLAARRSSVASIAETSTPLSWV